ncbi:uncharacterized protein LTR77_010997 [Saxophila tyrrhenica]|uniref:Protein kinase domain-containing protein n=1 Tax=Saxophila tyrrhenica TaxID=1690608 RepID=A0AAV9NVM6_9PEZI|nr:hypothetical protein LTR77_010997 [Saxophila tyrrhenica]
MTLIAATSTGIVLSDHREADQDACQEGFQDRFELVHAAGVGFFGIVFYALVKSDFAFEQSRLTDDPSRYEGAGGLGKIQAVKICNPMCPSGVKASASYLVKEITAMRTVWSRMEKSVHLNFVKLHDYSISNAPWYSMEPVMSGLTLEKLYVTTQAWQSTVPEELAFHIVDQLTKACLFLYEKCNIVRADTNRENFMLRYPGRQTPLLPDVVLIDWSLWEEADAGRIAKDTRKMYEAVFPVLFEGGWTCGASHSQLGCAIDNATHSKAWLDLYNTMSAKASSIQRLGEGVAIAAKESRQRVEADSQVANVVRVLMVTAGDRFTETSLRRALMTG